MVVIPEIRGFKTTVSLLPPFDAKGAFLLEISPKARRDLKEAAGVLFAVCLEFKTAFSLLLGTDESVPRFRVVWEENSVDRLANIVRSFFLSLSAAIYN